MRDCSNALKPLIAIRASDVKDACAKMSDVLPLVIVITEDAAQAASPEVMPAFLELAEAIGA